MKRQLLVIDDELSTQRLLEFLLSPFYNVKSFNNGSEALSWLNESHYTDLIITDAEMPVMNGAVFVKSLRENLVLKDIPVIVLSSEKPEVLDAQFKHLDVEVFLKKPIEPKVLFWRVEESLGKLANH